MERREFLTGMAATAVLGTNAKASTLPVPASGRIGFKVLRNGTHVGEYHTIFTRQGQDLTVLSEAGLVVRLAGIPVFRYRARVAEHWSAGVFQKVDSHVDDGVRRLWVHVRRATKGYDIQGTHVPRYMGPLDTLPLTYWNKAMLQAMIVNVQTAHSYPAIVHSPGWNKLPTANGGTLVAQRYNVTGKLHLTVWYDQAGQWAGLQFHKHGNVLFEKIVT